MISLNSQFEPLYYYKYKMKFTAISKPNKETYQELSSEEEDCSLIKNKSLFQTPVLAHRRSGLEPIIQTSSRLHINLEESVKKKSNTVVQVIMIQDSGDEDVYVPEGRPIKRRGFIDLEQDEPQPVIRGSSKSQTCTICLQDISPPYAQIRCGHIFCEECIVKSSNISNKCPNCRARYQQITIGTKVIRVKNKELEEELVDFDEEPCYVCGNNQRPEELLVCDHCEFAFCHVSCDSRLRGQMPEGQWYCNDCTLNRRYLS